MLVATEIERTHPCIIVPPAIAVKNARFTGFTANAYRFERKSIGRFEIEAGLAIDRRAINIENSGRFLFFAG